jgi:hypothetical protein
MPGGSTTRSATQCGSNPVSGRGLPKAGISRHTAGDFRHFHPHVAKFRALETDGQFAKGRRWRAFLQVPGTFSLSAGLPG